MAMAQEPVSTLQTTPHRIPRAVIDAAQDAAGEALIAFVVALTRAVLAADVSDDERDLLFRTFAYDAAGALKPIARMMRVVPGVADVLPAQLREVMSEARGAYGMEIIDDATLPMFAEVTPAPQPSTPLALAAPLTNEKGPDHHKLHEMARAARVFEESSNGPNVPPISDEMLLRASVAYAMLKRRGMIASMTDQLDEQHAIALIAANFSDVPASTPHRAALFAMKLDEELRG